MNVRSDSLTLFFFLDENLLNKNTELKKKVQSDRSQKMKKT